MTTETNSPTRRIFRYGDKIFPDPGSEYTTEQVLTHLKSFFPELGHAKTEEKVLEDGTVEITFSKQVSRKGSS